MKGNKGDLHTLNKVVKKIKNRKRACKEWNQIKDSLGKGEIQNRFRLRYQDIGKGENDRDNDEQ